MLASVSQIVYLISVKDHLIIYIGCLIRVCLK